LDRFAREIAANVPCQLAGTLVSPLRLLGETLEHDRLYLVVEGCPKRARPVRRHAGDMVHHLAKMPEHRIRKPPRQHLEENDAEGIDIGSNVDELTAAFDLLRAGPGQGADELPGLGEL